MRRKYLLLIFFLILPLFGMLFFHIQSTHAAKDEAATDEVIIKYKSNVSENEKSNIRAEMQGTLKEKLNKIQVEVIKIPPGKVDVLVQRFKNHANVEYVEPNFIAQATTISSDTSLSQQWGLFKINAANTATQSAWDVTTGTSSAKIAILDTGIQENHPDLLGKVVGDANFTNTLSVMDSNGHGTHTAGIAAAATNNTLGVAGVGYDTSLLNGKVLDNSGSGYYSWIANGIIWATDQGAQVISMSLSGTASSQALQDAVNYAYGKNVVIVAAAGNSGNTVPQYPAYYSNVIAVAATDSTDAKPSWSSYGSWVDVAAPGLNIYSTYKNSSYSTLSGTSMATPFAAGVAGLIWATGDCTTNVCVKDRLEQTADPIPGTGTYWIYGRINAYSAVTGTTPVANTPTPTLTPNPTPTPTLTPTPPPTTTVAPSPTMTVSAIDLSYTGIGSFRQITSTITVVNEASLSPLSSASIKGKLTSPTGAVTNFSGTSNSSGRYSFKTLVREKGTFTLTITSLTRSSYLYNPTLTSKTLLVQ